MRTKYDKCPAHVERGGREWNTERKTERERLKRTWARERSHWATDRQSECAAYWNVGHKVLWPTDDATETSLNVRYMPEFLPFRTIFSDLFWFFFPFLFFFCVFCKSIFLLGLAKTKTCFSVSQLQLELKPGLELSGVSGSHRIWALVFVCLCVCVFFAGLNISLDLVEPIQRHRLELGVAESEIEFKTCCGSGKNRCEEWERKEWDERRATNFCLQFFSFLFWFLYFVLLICVQTSII